MSFKQSARIQRDIKRRSDYNSLELYRNCMKSVVNDQTLPYATRLDASVELGKMGKKGSRTVIKNRCIRTGRSRGVLKRFRLSRIMIRHLIAEGKLPNIKKASW
ncbi:MAG: 30S ribosomal protein S14 [Rhodovulum sp.]|nr:30S ribosomal protein S14 [Rhodovulum sp.]